MIDRDRGPGGKIGRRIGWVGVPILLAGAAGVACANNGAEQGSTHTSPPGAENTHNLPECDFFKGHELRVGEGAVVFAGVVLTVEPRGEGQGEAAVEGFATPPLFLDSQGRVEAVGGVASLDGGPSEVERITVSRNGGPDAPQAIFLADGSRVDLDNSAAMREYDGCFGGETVDELGRRVPVSAVTIEEGPVTIAADTVPNVTYPSFRTPEDRPYPPDTVVNFTYEELRAYGLVGPELSEAEAKEINEGRTTKPLQNVSRNVPFAHENG